MGSIRNFENEEGNFVSIYPAWNPIDVPHGKEETDHRYGKQRIVNEAQADEDMTEMFVSHPKVVKADISNREVEIEGFGDLNHAKYEIETSNSEKTEEIGESLGRLLGDFHRNGISHGDPHLANFLYDDGDLMPFDFEFYSGNATIPEMKDDLRLLESDARTLETETYENLMEHVKNAYTNELKTDDTFSNYRYDHTSQNYESELVEFISTITDEINAVNSYYGLTRIIGSDRDNSKTQHAMNYVRNCF